MQSRLALGGCSCTRWQAAHAALACTHAVPSAASPSLRVLHPTTGCRISRVSVMDTAAIASRCRSRGPFAGEQQLGWAVRPPVARCGRSAAGMGLLLREQRMLCRDGGAACLASASATSSSVCGGHPERAAEAAAALVPHSYTNPNRSAALYHVSPVLQRRP